MILLCFTTVALSSYLYHSWLIAGLDVIVPSNISLGKYLLVVPLEKLYII
jgi:hypothetical protein